ncbi:MAG: cysteine--tRNA ligase [Phycisphaerales bacterium]|nr:cysteine--tRNA ligase [Phycisphaerales bacterium]
MNFLLYNTITKSQEPLIPADPSQITFYTCGPTVYDDAHIGNFRSFLAADLLRRWIESPLCTLQTTDGSTHTPTKDSPRTVTHVMNITDVGHMTDDDNADGAGQDKMELAAQRIKTSITESKKDGSLHKAADIDPNNPRAIADFYEARFKKDAIALGLKVAIEAQADPTLMPRASDYVQHMKQVIAELITKDYAYTAGTPGSRAIYFNTQSFPNYGKLSGNTLENLKGGAGGRVDESQQSEKKHLADFLLWKEDDTHKMKWPAPDHADCAGWDEGYPGWHIECTAMALSRLVDKDLNPAAINNATIDLHSGGEDNIFPHHECEIAQSCCFTGQVDQDNPSFARHWFHARFLKVEGEKMSKSKGTMYTLTDLTDKGIDPAAVRLELIKTHYRANADFSMQGLADSAKQIARWRRFIEAAQSGPKGQTNTIVQDQVAKALSDDLNIAGALGVINTWIKNTDTPSQADTQTFNLFDQILGVLSLKQPEAEESKSGIALYQPGVTPSPEIESLLTKRAEAKKAKDFTTADAIRDQLTALNLTIMDKPGGKVEVAPAN